MAEALAYIGAAIIGLWGAAHIVPTRQVVAGFGAISRDNRLVITQEWIAEGVAMMFIAVLVAVVTAVTRPPDATTVAVYRLSAAMLIALAVLTGTTGARTPTLWFKACPVVKSIVAALLLVASVA